MKQNLGFGINSIWYRLKQLKITLKKVTERSQEDRQRFTDKISKIDHSSILYIDEAGVDNRLYREYGRAPKGEKIYALEKSERE